MKAYLGEWSLILLCFSMAGAIGGGLLRTHSPAALVEKIAARVVLGDSAEHRGSVAAVLDSGASRDHGVRRCCPCADV